MILVTYLEPRKTQVWHKTAYLLSSYITVNMLLNVSEFLNLYLKNGNDTYLLSFFVIIKSGVW